MRAHIVSFLRAPLGYLSNLFATCWVHVEEALGRPSWLMWMDYPICFMCETFCIEDGIQDDMLF